MQKPKVISLKNKAALRKATDAQLKETYDFVGMEIYEITNKFPCLTRKNVPNGVSNAKYALICTYLSLNLMVTLRSYCKR